MSGRWVSFHNRTSSIYILLYSAFCVRKATAEEYPKNFALLRLAEKTMLKAKQQQDSIQPLVKSQPQETAPVLPFTNSTSPELSEILVCVEDQCFKAWLPTITHPPDVDFLVRWQPAQSASVCTSMWSTFCTRYTYTRRSWPWNRHTHFDAHQLLGLGFDIDRHTSLEANCASMRSLVN